MSHCGKYSIERLVALEEYTQTTSTGRVLLVCLLTPLPVLFVVLGMECVPLYDPGEGWRVNYGIWIWTAAITLVGACSMVDQMRYFIAPIQIRPLPVVFLSAFLSAVPVMAGISIAEAWAFPIPFSVFFLAPINVMTFLVAGAYFFRSMLKDRYYRNRFKHYGVFLVLLGWLIIVYPAYTIIFARIAGAGYEITALLMLSVIRTAFRNAFARSAAHLEDAVPQLVIFTTDYFNALYLATNMQSVSSTSSVLAMFVIDSGQLMLSVRWLLRRLKVLENRVDSNILGEIKSSSNALFIAVTLADSGKHVMDAKDSNIRLMSSIPHKLTHMSTQRLEIMRRSFNTENRTKNEARWSFPQLKWAIRVAPTSSKALGPLSITPSITSSITSSMNSTEVTGMRSRRNSASDPVAQLERALQLAYTIEYTALSEYLEAVVPVMYTIYVCILRRLPNARYHSNLADVSDTIFDRTVNNMIFYALMELISFAILLTVIQTRVRLNVLYVVAFVLETQVTLVQGMLVTWMVTTRQYEIQHFGAYV